MTFKKIMIAILLASFSFGVGAYYRFNVIKIKPVPLPPPLPISGDISISSDQPEPLEIAGRINILVLGEDNIESVKRSDTILFVAIDIDDRNVRVLSLPRDTRVSIPGHGNQKLNHAYAYGGVDLLRATVDRFLGTGTHYYVKIDYDNFPKLVDIVGGVDIFVGRAMKYRDRKQNLHIDIPQGKQRMNGETALKYVRFRNDALGDIGRIRRQQQFLKAFLHRIYEPENLVRFPTIMNEIKNTLATDMDPSVILQLGSFVKRLEKETNRIFFKMLPGEAAIIDNLSYWIPYRAGTDSFLKASTQELIEMESTDTRAVPEVTTAADYSPDSPEGVRRPQPVDAPSTQDIMENVNGISEAIAILNGSGRGGVAQIVSSHLQKMGVDVAHVGNAKHFDYRSSIVIYPENATQSAKNSAEKLAAICGIPAALVRADKQASFPSLVVGKNYETLIKRLENSYATIQQ